MSGGQNLDGKHSRFSLFSNVRVLHHTFPGGGGPRNPRSGLDDVRNAKVDAKHGPDAEESTRTEGPLWGAGALNCVSRKVC